MPFCLSVRYVADASEKDLVTLGFQVSKDETDVLGEYFYFCRYIRFTHTLMKTTHKSHSKNMHISKGILVPVYPPSLALFSMDKEE